MLDIQRKLTRKEQAVQTKGRIFDAARKLLAEKPIENITVQEIVSEAGVSVGTFYLYFTTKHDVFFEAHIKSDQYFIMNVKPALNTRSTAECLDLFLFTYGDLIVRDIGKRMVKLMFSGNNKYFTRRGGNTVPGILENIVKKGVRAGVFSDADMNVNDITELYLALARGLIYDWSFKDEDYDLPARMVKFGHKIYKSLTI